MPDKACITGEIFLPGRYIFQCLHRRFASHKCNYTNTTFCSCNVETIIQTKRGGHTDQLTIDSMNCKQASSCLMLGRFPTGQEVGKHSIITRQLSFSDQGLPLLAEDDCCTLKSIQIWACHHVSIFIGWASSLFFTFLRTCNSH